MVGIDEETGRNQEVGTPGLDGPEDVLGMTENFPAWLGEGDAPAPSWNSVSALVWRIDGEGRVIWSNRAWEEYTGLSAAHRQGGSWIEVLHEQDRDAVERAIAETDSSKMVDVRIANQDRAYHWFLLNAGIPTSDEADTSTRTFFAILNDERKAAEAVREAELADTRMMLQNVPTMVWRTTASGAMDYANERYLKRWGRTLEEMVGAGWAGSVHPDDRQGIVDYWTKHIETSADGSYEFRVGSPEHGYRWHLSISTPRQDEDGRVLQWYGATFDIEDRKRAEQKLLTNEAFLRQGQLISKSGSVGADLTTGEHYWSDETYRILEIQPDVEPAFEPYLQRVHPDDIEFVKEHLERVKRNESDVEFEHRLLFPDGRIKYLRVLVNPPHAESDELSTLGVIMDITSTKLAEQEIHRAQSELTRVTRIATMAELTASIAHEINQPLSGILTNGEACLRWLNRQEPDLAEALEAVERVVIGTRRVSDVVRQLRAIFTRKEPDPSEFDLNDLVTSTLPLLRSHINHSRGTVGVSLTEDMPRIFADPVQIQQVLINLLMNGLQAPRASDDAERRLVVETSTSGGVVSLHVNDDGLGIPETHLSQIFEPFFTTKSDGMGMGLSICRSIIESHGGKMIALKNQHGGATVGFELPLNKG